MNLPISAADFEHEKTEGPTTLNIFVYGTLQPGGRYHQRYCAQHLSHSVPAIVRGQLYDFPKLGYPAMIAGDDWVQGYLLTFTQPFEVCKVLLQHLDRLEGYSPEAPLAENEYVRLQMQTYRPTRQPLQMAWGYVMSEAQVRSQGGVYLPNGNWR